MVKKNLGGALLLCLGLARGFVLVPSARVAPKTVLDLAVGDKLPMDGEFMVMGDGPTPLPVSDVFAGKTVVVFGIPGALTPTCTDNQAPGYVAKADDFKAKGVDTVACLACNDPFVMNEFAKKVDPDGKLQMLGDGGAAFVKAVGLDVDTGNFGGVRCSRCAFVVKDGTVEVAQLEDGTGFTDVSAADTLITMV